MRSPKFTHLDVVVLFNVTAKTTAHDRRELPAALASLKAGLAALSKDAADELALSLLFAQHAKPSGGSGAPAELTLFTATAAPLAN